MLSPKNRVGSAAESNLGRVSYVISSDCWKCPGCLAMVEWQCSWARVFDLFHGKWCTKCPPANSMLAQVGVAMAWLHFTWQQLGQQTAPKPHCAPWLQQGVSMRTLSSGAVIQSIPDSHTFAQTSTITTRDRKNRGRPSLLLHVNFKLDLPPALLTL